MTHLLLLILLLFPAPSWAAIAFDTATTSEAEAGAASSHSHTFAAGSVGVICMSQRESGGAAQPATGVTVGGAAATFVGGVTNVNNVIRVDMFVMANPGTGVQTVVATPDATTDRLVTSVISYTGVSTLTPIGAATTAQTASTNIDTNTIASAIGEMAVQCGAARRGAADVTATPDATSPASTERIDNPHDNTASSVSGFLYEEASTGSTVDIRVDITDSAQWAAVAASLREASTTRRQTPVFFP